MTTKKQSKRILSVTIKRMHDDSPDTSWLGKYSNTRASEFSIDRAHSEDCQSVSQEAKDAIETLERVISHINRERLKAGEDANNTEWESLDASIDLLIELQKDLEACDCGERGDRGRNEYRYFNFSFNYVDKDGAAAHGNTPEEIRKYTRQDYERMEGLNRGDWSFIGISAEAEIWNSQTQVCQHIYSGGLWGVESDAGKEYIEEIEHEELNALKTELLALGFSRRAISTAFKNIQRTE